MCTSVKAAHRRCRSPPGQVSSFSRRSKRRSADQVNRFALCETATTLLAHAEIPTISAAGLKGVVVNTCRLLRAAERRRKSRRLNESFQSAAMADFKTRLLDAASLQPPAHRKLWALTARPDESSGER